MEAVKPNFGTVKKVGTYVSERTHRETDRVKRPNRERKAVDILFK